MEEVSGPSAIIFPHPQMRGQLQARAVSSCSHGRCIHPQKRGQLQGTGRCRGDPAVPPPARAGSVTGGHRRRRGARRVYPPAKAGSVTGQESSICKRCRVYPPANAGSVTGTTLLLSLHSRSASTRKRGVSYRYCAKCGNLGEGASTRESGVSYRTARQTIHMATMPVIGHKTHHHPMSPEGEKRKKTEKLPPKNFRGAKISATENPHAQNPAAERNPKT